MDNSRLSIDFASFAQVVREFIRAIGQRRTYNLFKNWYCFFGILWGIPIPFVTLGIDLFSSGLNVTLTNIKHLASIHPFQIIFLLHPLFFGVVFGAMGTIRQTKQQKIEEFEKNLIKKNLELELVNKKLKELDRLKSNFLSMVSHELRTPLTTIQGYISFLISEKSGSLNPGQKECLRLSEESAIHLNHLIEELLDLSKIEAGEFKVNLRPVDILEVAEKAKASLQILANEQGITLENSLPKGLPLVLADAERILQVITNLLENAIKFNRAGGKVSIAADTSTQNEKIVFCILDTGIGITQDKLDRIFDKFYQVDSSGKRKYGGCGLGLTISKRILEMHHGRIWVESTVAKGSKFYFELLTLNKNANS